MPTFKNTNSQFDDIEYWITEESWMGREAAFIVFENCDGSAYKSSRIYRNKAEAESCVADDLGFMILFWTGQLTDRERAIVCNGNHYRYNTFKNAPARHRGFGGMSWTFIEIATGWPVTSSDVWYQGTIPVWARKAFPDTHTQG